MTTKAVSFLPYHEPGIVPILIQSSFLLALNVVNTVFDKLIFCGLLGQVFVGVGWGTPGAKWLDHNLEEVIVQLGYLGLILLVYEGGLSTNFRSLKANIVLSIAVAVTGIGFPVGLSFVLQSLVNATPLQAFAAGAALCSTSLGTTFTILSTSGLSNTRLGIVLSSAAMMDDVVGLVMVQVISNLGESADSFNAVTVVRPLAVSIGFAVAVPLLCEFLARPLTLFLNDSRKSNPGGALNALCEATHTAFILHTLLLYGLVTGASYAGTSNLFAAYLTGAAISWWDTEVLHSTTITPDASSESLGQTDSTPGNRLSDSEETRDQHHESTAGSGSQVYHKYYATAVQRILKPFFFASIGFAIPVTDMFDGNIFWKGIVYTILMLLAKLVTGLWLVRLNLSLPNLSIPVKLRSIILTPRSCINWTLSQSKKISRKTVNTSDSHELRVRTSAGAGRDVGEPSTQANDADSSKQSQPGISNASPSRIDKPLSLYPAAMLGTAMTSRGEIGFLIASLAETSGLFSPSSHPRAGSSEIYLVVTWAIVLCTIIGPVAIGTLTKRVRRLQGSMPRLNDPLGIWGVY